MLAVFTPSFSICLKLCFQMFNLNYYLKLVWSIWLTFIYFWSLIIYFLLLTKRGRHNTFCRMRDIFLHTGMHEQVIGKQINRWTWRKEKDTNLIFCTYIYMCLMTLKVIYIHFILKSYQIFWSAWKFCHHKKRRDCWGNFLVL